MESHTVEEQDETRKEYYKKKEEMLPLADTFCNEEWFIFLIDGAIACYNMGNPYTIANEVFSQRDKFKKYGIKNPSDMLSLVIFAAENKWLTLNPNEGI